MINNFDNIFNQISSLTKFQLEAIGFEFYTTEELDYFCFSILIALLLQQQQGYQTEHFNLQFIQYMQNKYGQYHGKCFANRLPIYQHYLSYSFANQTTHNQMDPLISLGYILGDLSINDHFDVHSNIILVAMTLKNIIQQCKAILPAL